ncbi:MAG: stage III sporulation protein AB [Firmicutes bacterium]|nr:stage III sporulation protein AB [Bacillota bacterium]
MRAVLAVAACCLIMGACAGLGSWGAARLRRRINYLSGLIRGVDSLMRDIDYLALPLPEALEQAADCAGEAAAAFAAAARLLRSGQGLSGSEAWLTALTETDCGDCMPVAACIGAGLGETDAAGQLQQLDACRQRLDLALEEAEKDLARFGRIWRAGGWCGGAVLILLLL